ncbi:oligopeptide/dipeptide ABC transporter, ATPase subunit [Streptomyces lincolnensis]|uniref:Oligopeptide/dipeptide ABC transporter, ATPase subunit n=1 Tax=Streptomyces lincolnensis TaxID=1915 RepID=A0A1B1M256_STRLN|nr:dipeptide/oligopeptide/nickel ABC transporter permease/ATP-binding protein [Streptomyces lincolnensis]ANS62534.1 oligopeptide/dipeptide ABC transporter, ATPase subunit [Streptomyces lincolnensis]AXG51459.1 oligopeptide/dipeptide ABC transporter, ATPase subunit [Streptomyces lincolnensis]
MLGTQKERGSAAEADRPGARHRWPALLLQDRFAFAAALVLVVVALCAVLGPVLVGDLATRQNLRDPGREPFSLEHGWAYVLGSDSLGRPVAARMIAAASTTMSVAVPAVLCSLVVGSLWGMWAGFHAGWRENVSLRVADVILSFPSLLLAVVVLYVFSPSVAALVLVLAVARIPVYLRTARAESAELRSRLFMDAARTFGTGSWASIRRHVAPSVLPTLLTVAALDFCFVMLTESSLSFLGIGIQPPDVSWGLMVAQGRQELRSAWWIAVFPGLAIVVTTVSATVLAAWARLSTDPGQRWRRGLRGGSRRVRARTGGGADAPVRGAGIQPAAPDRAVALDSTATTTPVSEDARSAALAVEGLSVDVHTPAGPAAVVRGVSFSVRSGQTLALLGESGCGKSMTAHAVAGLLDPAAKVVGGEARLGGEDLLALSGRARRRLAGPGVGIVFQDALSALNPVQTVGAQLAEPFRIHERMSRRAARAKAVDLMERVGISEARSRVGAYPHQFSGGMRQRLLIAMAVALRPRVLLADEPTTALDVTVQAQIMDLLDELRGEQRMALVLITHDLGLVADHADHVAVMYAGTVVETGPVSAVFAKPHHPYTRGLLESVPAEQHKGGRLNSIPGSPPDPLSVPTGCAFRTRCPMAREVCATLRPALAPTGADRAAACHFGKELADA